MNGTVTTRNVYTLAVFGDEIYAGYFGDPSILFSSDNGATWMPRNTGLSTKTVHGFIKKGDRLFAATWGGGVFMSTDNGLSWVEKNTGIVPTINPTIKQARTFIVLDETIFLGTQPETGGLYRSTDNGETWTNKTTFPTALTFEIGGDILYSGTENGVYSSKDNGLNWISIGLAGKKITTLSINGSTIFASTDNNEINWSTNLGVTWTTIPKPTAIKDKSAAVLKGLADVVVNSLLTSGTTLFAGTNNGVFRTKDNGVNWTPVNKGLKTLEIALLSTNDNALVAVASNGEVFRSDDNGENWGAMQGRLPSYENNIPTSMTSAGKILFAGTNHGGIFQSEDNGSTWSVITNGLSDYDVLDIAVDGNVLYASLSDGSFWQLDISKTTTAVNEEVNSDTHDFTRNAITVYPNPSNGTVQILYTSNGSELTELYVTDIYGRKLADLTNIKQEGRSILSTLNTNDWVEGVYMVVLRTPEKSVTKKLVVLR